MESPRPSRLARVQNVSPLSSVNLCASRMPASDVIGDDVRPKGSAERTRRRPPRCCTRLRESQAPSLPPSQAVHAVAVPGLGKGRSSPFFPLPLLSSSSEGNERPEGEEGTAAPTYVYTGGKEQTEMSDRSLRRGGMDGGLVRGGRV